jgi:iron complex transport system substrate-binding protein
MRRPGARCMRAFASCLAASLALALAAVPAPAAPPQRVASLNLCTDELLLALAAPGQIVSVTHLAHSPAETPLWAAARLYPRNHGSLLSVARLRPDLVLTMGGGGRDRARIAGRLGIATLDVPYAAGLDDAAANIRLVAEALGRPAAGAALLARLDRLRATAPAAPRDAIWLGGGGRSVAHDGLEAQWMRLAGLAQRPLPGARADLETLLRRPPRVLLRSDYRAGQTSAGQSWLAHPLARGRTAGRTLRADGRRWTCMGPPMLDEIVRLRQEAAR